MTLPVSALAVAAVCLLTSVVALTGLRFSRGTSDFYVAGRTVTPWRNASAIGGEYLSAASFLGIAGIMYERGMQGLWLPVGYSVGYLVLLVLVAAPLRRSGAYTLADFAQFRLDSLLVRRLSAMLVAAIGVLYLIPQLQGAGLVLTYVTGWPHWVGAILSATIVTFNVALAGMQSITLVQALQYWLKLTAIAVPGFVLVAVWSSSPGSTPAASDAFWNPVPGPDGMGLYSTYSLLLALCLGGAGLPHVVVRFYTNPTGRAARRTTVAVLALLGLFYVWPPVLGTLARSHLAEKDLASDTALLHLPEAMTDGALATALTAMLCAGAFAALLSTAGGVLMAVAGVIDQDVVRPIARNELTVVTFRLATVMAVLVPLAVALLAPNLRLSSAVGFAFTLAATTFTPMVVLGVWWRGLTAPGAVAGMTTGALCVLGAAIGSTFAHAHPVLRAVLDSPAAWTVPLATSVMVVGSLLTPGARHRDLTAVMMRLHLPEGVLRDT